MMYGCCCDICDSERSLFYHPFCYGYMMLPEPAKRDGLALHREQSFTMCDDCYKSFISWAEKRQENTKPVKVNE